MDDIPDPVIARHVIRQGLKPDDQRDQHEQLKQGRDQNTVQDHPRPALADLRPYDV